VLRRHLLAVVCFAAAGLIGLAAVADHRNKNARSNRAQVSEWYCEHRGTRCGGPSSASIEAHWQSRQWAYEVAVVALGGFAIVSFAYRLARPA
jgi:hypothetical protein